MRTLLVFSAVCAILASGSQTPLVSVTKLSELVTDSVALSVDMTKFASAKIEESLSGQPKEIYSHFTRQVVGYKKMVADAYAASPVSSIVAKSVGIVFTLAAEQYNRINSLSARIIDPIVREFETKFPASKGLVGPSIADRLLLGFWLVWFVKFAARLALSVFTSTPRRYKA